MTLTRAQTCALYALKDTGDTLTVMDLIDRSLRVQADDGRVWEISVDGTTRRLEDS